MHCCLTFNKCARSSNGDLSAQCVDTATSVCKQHTCHYQVLLAQLFKVSIHLQMLAAGTTLSTPKFLFMVTGTKRT